MAAVVIGGTSANVGTTSIVWGLSTILRHQGHNVQLFKIGPDVSGGVRGPTGGPPMSYINLDLWLQGRDLVCELYHQYQQQGAGGDAPDISIMEGCKGLFDDPGSADGLGSTADLAKLLSIPVVLVVDALHAARSIAAVIKGYCEMDPALRVSGVIFNKVRDKAHTQELKQAVEERTGVLVLGGVPVVPELQEGVFPQNWTPSLLEATAYLVANNLDISLLMELAQGSRTRPWQVGPPPAPRAPKVQIGIVQDEALGEYYQRNLDLLQQAGARLVPFSLMLDDQLPPGLSGLYLGGGGARGHWATLSANKTMLAAVRAFIDAGGVVLAESSGLLYLSRSVQVAPTLTYSTVCALPFRTHLVEGSVKLGYVNVRVEGACPIFPSGAAIRGHLRQVGVLVQEQVLPGITQASPLPQHRSWQYSYRARLASPVQSREYVDEGYTCGNMVASFVHLHWNDVSIAKSVVQRCLTVDLACVSSATSLAVDEAARQPALALTVTGRRSLSRPGSSGCVQSCSTEDSQGHSRSCPPSRRCSYEMKWDSTGTVSHMGSVAPMECAFQTSAPSPWSQGQEAQPYLPPPAPCRPLPSRCSMEGPYSLLREVGCSKAVGAAVSFCHIEAPACVVPDCCPPQWQHLEAVSTPLSRSSNSSLFSQPSEEKHRSWEVGGLGVREWTADRRREAEKLVTGPGASSLSIRAAARDVEEPVLKIRVPGVCEGRESTCTEGEVRVVEESSEKTEAEEQGAPQQQAGNPSWPHEPADVQRQDAWRTFLKDGLPSSSAELHEKAIGLSCPLKTSRQPLPSVGLRQSASTSSLPTSGTRTSHSGTLVHNRRGSTSSLPNSNGGYWEELSIATAWPVSRNRPCTLERLESGSQACFSGASPVPMGPCAPQFESASGSSGSNNKGIVSFSPGGTGCVVALGLGDRLAGVTDLCEVPRHWMGQHVVVCHRGWAGGHKGTPGCMPSGLHPVTNIDPLANRLPALAGGLKCSGWIDVQFLASRAVSLVIIPDHTGCEHLVSKSKTLSALRQAGLLQKDKDTCVVCESTKKLADLLDFLLILGKFADCEGKARELVQELRRRLRVIAGHVSSLAHKPRVLVLDTLHMPSESTVNPYFEKPGLWIPEMKHLAGAHDDGQVAGSPAEAVTWGQIRQYAPEVLVLTHPYEKVDLVARAAGELAVLPGWWSLPAVRSGRVFVMDCSLLRHPGPKLVDGVEVLAKIFHPEVVELCIPPGQVMKLSLHGGHRCRQRLLPNYFLPYTG